MAVLSVPSTETLEALRQARISAKNEEYTGYILNAVAQGGVAELTPEGDETLRMLQNNLTRAGKRMGVVFGTRPTPTASSTVVFTIAEFNGERLSAAPAVDEDEDEEEDAVTDEGDEAAGDETPETAPDEE